MGISNNVFRIYFRQTILDEDCIDYILKIFRETQGWIWLDDNCKMCFIPNFISPLNENDAIEEYRESLGYKRCKEWNLIGVPNIWCNDDCYCDRYDSYYDKDIDLQKELDDRAPTIEELEE